MKHFLSLLLSAVVTAWLVLAAPANADGTCKDHYPYRVIDGHGHDRDGDGVGCESNPRLPARGQKYFPGTTNQPVTTQPADGYDRDNWDYNSSAARRRLGCSVGEHVDHIVALKEAYDSGASSWTSDQKETFANDPNNQWCLDGRTNISKSDSDLAEWSGGTCEQRKTIAQVTKEIKRKYDLATDEAEKRAIQHAKQAQC